MNDTHLSFDNLAHVSHMQRLPQEESEHFEISGPFEGSLCLGRVSHSRGMQRMSGAWGNGVGWLCSTVWWEGAAPLLP